MAKIPKNFIPVRRFPINTVAQSKKLYPLPPHLEKFVDSLKGSGVHKNGIRGPGGRRLKHKVRFSMRGRG